MNSDKQPNQFVAALSIRVSFYLLVCIFHLDLLLFSPGARSDALASLLLELHGLQDMLGGLWEWVAGAEATMAQTEASSVGNDMETVETQLAQHEVSSLIVTKFSLSHLPVNVFSIYLLFFVSKFLKFNSSLCQYNFY